MPQLDVNPEWPSPPEAGEARGRTYLAEVLGVRSDVEAADVWALALRMSEHRDEDDVHRDLGLRLASGWSLDDIEYSLRVLG